MKKRLKYFLIVFVFFLVHCDVLSFQKGKDRSNKKSCTDKGSCNQKNKDENNNDNSDEEDNSDYNDEEDSNSSFFYLLNKTGGTVKVYYKKGSEKIETFISHRQCMSFDINDLRYVELKPTKCLWHCPEGQLGCRLCPKDAGYYVMDLENFPDDRHPSMYNGFEKTKRWSNPQSCLKLK